MLYRLGSRGPQLPNHKLIYQPPPASLHRDTVLLACFGCYLQPARQVVCICGRASLGCVCHNEMALKPVCVSVLPFSPQYDVLTDISNERLTGEPS